MVVEAEREALSRDLQYNLKLLEEKKERLQCAIAIAEKEQDDELKESVALSNCTTILEDDRLIRFAITGEEMLKRIADDNICGQDDMMGKHLEKAAHLVQKLCHTGTEEVEMVDVNSDQYAKGLRGALSRLVSLSQISLGISDGSSTPYPAVTGFRGRILEGSAAKSLLNINLLQALLHRLTSNLLDSNGSI